MHGGAGALISIGLFRQMPYEDMHKCIQQAYSSGGDGFITECLWEVCLNLSMSAGQHATGTRHSCLPNCKASQRCLLRSWQDPFMLSAAIVHGFERFHDLVQAGFGMTNPDPLYHPRNLTMFDPSPPGPQPDDDILRKAAHTLGNLLAAAAGICHGLCKVQT